VDWESRREVGVLVGKVLTAVKVNDAKDEIRFECADGDVFLMHHEQDCCESVGIEEVVGNLDDLIGTPVVLADDVSNEAGDKGPKKHDEGTDYEYHDESATWTFYRFRTIKGDVDIRWYGHSNGYYSERVDFNQIEGQGLDGSAQ